MKNQLPDAVAAAIVAGRRLGRTHPFQGLEHGGPVPGLALEGAPQLVGDTLALAHGAQVRETAKENASSPSSASAPATLAAALPGLAERR